MAEPAMLFHLLGTAPLPTRVCVWSDEKLIEVEIVVAGREAIEADYREIAYSGGAEQRRGVVDAWMVVLQPRDGDRDFEFLGLSGEITIMLEQRRRIPLRVEGKLSGLGRVTVKLEEAELSS